MLKQNDSIDPPRAVDVGDALSIEFEARQASSLDEEDGPIFQEVKDWLVVVGDKDVIPVLEMGLRFMHEGETSLVYGHSKYAYGPLGRKQGEYVLPPDSNIVYRVKINKLVRDGEERFSPEFQLEVAANRKKIGNDCYQFEWSDGYGKGRALQLYNKAAKEMTNLLTESTDEAIQEQAMAILVDCLNNIAAVYMKAKEYGKAKEAATQVILRDSNNMKALLRAARAALYDPAGSFEESEAAIAAAEQVNPDDKDLGKLKAELSRKKKEYKKKSKAMFSKMNKAVKSESVSTGESPASETKHSNHRPGTSVAGKADLKSVDEPSAEQTATATNEFSSNEVDEAEEGSWKKYLPYLFQIVMPFIMYYFFSLMKQQAESARLAPDAPVSNSEF